MKLTSRIAQAFIIAAMLGFTSLVFAEPSLRDINQTLESGNIAKADALMKEVISAHPESAKAHFKYAEILAAESKFAEARTELSHAEKLQPNLEFATPAAVKALNQKLYQNSQSAHSGTNPLIMWAVIALIVFFVVMVMRAMRRPQVQPNYGTNPPMAAGYGPQGTPYQAGYGPQGYGLQGGGLGSGIAGGLATGAAVGAGIVAGEMLMHKVLDDNQTGGHDSTRNQPAPDNFNDISGSDFVDGGNGSWDSDSSGSDFSSDSDSGGDWS